MPEAERGARAHAGRQAPDVPAAKRGHIGERPVGGVAAGARDDLIVGGRFFAMQKAEDGAERREADAPIAHAGRAQPVFVELEPVWGYVGDALMQARDEQAADSGVNHDEGVRI